MCKLLKIVEINQVIGDMKYHMQRVVFIYERKIPTIEILHSIFNNNETNIVGVECVFLKIDCIKWDQLRNVSVVVFIRCQDLLSQLMLVELKKQGCFCVQFYDDDLNCIPMEEKRYVQRLAWRKKAIALGFSKTDCILVSNPLLGEKYSKLIPSERFATINTPVQNELKNVSYNIESNDEIKILYAASPKHLVMFDKYIMPIIPQLVEKYHKRVSFSFIGVKPDLSQFDGQLKYNCYAAMPLEDYREFTKDGHFQIGIAPLESNEFTQYKYYNKFIEYTIVGAVGVYSDVPPYNLVIRNQENGFLAQNDANSWLKALCNAIDDQDLRKKCFDSAYSFLKNERTYSSVLNSVVEDLPELKHYSVCNIRRWALFRVKAKYTFYRLIEIIVLLSHFMINEGPKNVAKRIKNYYFEKNTRGREKVDINE